MPSSLCVYPSGWAELKPCGSVMSMLDEHQRLSLSLCYPLAKRVRLAAGSRGNRVDRRGSDVAGAQDGGPERGFQVPLLGDRADVCQDDPGRRGGGDGVCVDGEPLQGRQQARDERMSTRECHERMAHA
eukprot:639629-Rhodomonas_salina.2